MAANSDEMAKRSSELVEACVASLDRVVGGPQIKSKVLVRWNSRMRSTAGRAFWPECRVDLNPRLIEFGLGEVRRTVLHELAHLLAYARAGRRRIAPHGIEWQVACADLGIPGETATHQLALPRVQQRRKWAYRCPHCGFELQRVRKIKHKVACARCCGQFNGGRFCARFVLQQLELA